MNEELRRSKSSIWRGSRRAISSKLVRPSSRRTRSSGTQIAQLAINGIITANKAVAGAAGGVYNAGSLLMDDLTVILGNQADLDPECFGCLD